MKKVLKISFLFCLMCTLLTAVSLAETVDEEKLIPARLSVEVDNYGVELQTGNVVKITAENLVKHENTDGDSGHWIGFALVNPDATDVKYAFAAAEEELTTLSGGLEENVDGEYNEGIAFYADAGSEEPKIWAKVQWYDAQGELDGPITYKMDLSGVVLELDSKPTPVEARLNTEASVVDYDVNVNGNKVEIEANNLSKHANGELTPKLGHWIGFALKAPEGATKVGYAFTKAEGELEDTFAIHELEENIDGEYNRGVAFYTDAGSEEPKKYVKVQWYQGECKLGTPTSYEMDLSKVTLKLDTKPIPVEAKLNPTATVTGYEIDNTQEGIVKIKATDLVKHANSNNPAKDGYWIGFALQAPEGATDVAYIFSEDTILETEVLTKQELEINVVGDKPGIAFYTDAGSATPKKYVKVQWYQGECRLGESTEYEIDLSAVTLKSPDVLVQKAILKSETYAEKYSVTGVIDGNAVKVTITAENVVKHANEADVPIEGYWLGFALKAPEGATGVKYKFKGENQVELERLEENVTANGDSGLAVYVDAAKPKDQVEVVWVYNGMDGNIIVYDIAVNVTYTVTFKSNGSDYSKPQVALNGIVSKPTNPIRTGYTFGGWYKEAGCTNAYDFTTPVTAKITLYAKWTKNSSSGGGGGGSSSDEVQTYKITVTEGKNGSISPSGTVKVERGDNQRFKIKPDKGYEIEDVLVDGESVGAIDSYTFKNVKKKHTIKATFQKIKEETKEEEKVEVKPEVKLDIMPEVRPTQANKKYTDVKEEAWYVTPIEYVTRNNLMNGVGNDKFNPSEKGTRAMIVTILYNKEGKPAVTGKATFKDVTSGAWYEGPIAWAKANNIANGYQDGSFGPSESVTREQLAVMLYNYAKSKGTVSTGNTEMKFADNADIHNWAQEAMKWCVSNKIINGKGNNKLDPRGFATRAEIATMIMNFCEMK